MVELKVTTVGSSAGVVLPKEALARLNVAKGDKLYMTEAPDGSFRISAYDPEFAEQLEAVERVMREDKEILRALAK
ncbi:AbrB/MazE/SpoVT family DNA-binding domain-containing protein [Alphaproteobacteria bacterium]|jgi:putative addiction module antidote|nr:AbrB/MazE/SpoVT family DNA-binding domain-containing protein [Alphaproteobacteria bacterium]